MNEQDFNKQYPVGSPVVYYPIAGEPECEETTTKSIAWTLGSGHVVVKVVGHAGGVSVDHIKPSNKACSGLAPAVAHRMLVMK